jgi:hemolysin D
VFCAALLWAWSGTIDIVASATGKIQPGDGTKVVQPFETAIVRSIRVQDGQAVKYRSRLAVSREGVELGSNLLQVT